ncbi:alpha/beta hydrolase [Microcoleus sp. CAWBG58]|uniref:alpha/beta hydrolase n=1 Tax=Microcoleus sp. CAWBG58 TaxID=2841651 RepID=UPI0025CBE1B0|nr:alpha/beta hydrolase [Microcoleus sp. CAWBG58]
MSIRPNLRWFSSVASVCSAIAIGTFGAMISPAKATETVVVRKGPLESSISVADLRELAKTGKVPPRLQAYANLLSDAQRSQILGALQAKIPLNVVGLSNLLNTRIGTAILTDLTTVIPRGDGAGVEALRAALVLGANAPEGLSVLSFIESYPSSRVVVDLDRAFAVLSNLNSGFWQTQRFMAAIAPQLTATKPAFNPPFDPTQPGPNSVRVLKLDLNDSARNRRIPVDVYWSRAATADKPTIVFSHGLGSVRTDLRYLAEHLASYGYVVAAVEHPGSNETNTKAAIAGKSQLLASGEFLDRPKDISFVLDELAKLNQTDDNLQGKIAIERSMIVGYSFGGATALSVAGAELQLSRLKQRCQGDLIGFSLGEGIQCAAARLPQERYQLRDVRIKRAIVMNPTTSLLFGETGLSAIQIPTLIVASSADKTTPALVEQIAGFTKISSPKWLVGFVGGTHLSVKDPSTTLDQVSRPSTVISGDEVVGEKAVSIRNYIKAISLATAAQLTTEADKYAVFLTPEYAQFASTNAIPVRLVTEISSETNAVVQSFIQQSR